MWYVLRQVKIFMGYSASRIYCVIGANEYTIDMGRLGALHWYFAQNSMSFLGLDSLSRMVGAASESLRVAGSWRGRTFLPVLGMGVEHTPLVV